METSFFHNKNREIATALLLVVVSFLPVLSESEHVLKNAHYYLMAHIAIYYFYLALINRAFVFFTVVNVLYLYIVFSLSLGSIVYANGLVKQDAFIESYININDADVILLYYMLALTLLVFYEIFTVRSISDKMNSVCPINHSKKIIYIPWVLLFFVFYKLDLSYFGAKGNFSVFPITVFVVTAFVSLVQYKKISVVMAVLLLAGFSIISYGDRRDVIFLLFPFLLLYFSYHRTAFDIRFVAISSTMVMVVIALVVLMSISRSLAYQLQSQIVILDAIYHFKSYFDSLEFLTNLLNNFEVTYFFIHAINSVQAILNDPELIAYGSTIIKMFFIFFPRSIFGDLKPDQMTEKYTAYYDSVYREAGNSYPINVLAEFFWNFHGAALIFIPLFGMFASKISFQIIKYALVSGSLVKVISSLSIFVVVMNTTRGSGFDYLVYGGILSVFFSVLVVQNDNILRGMRSKIYLSSRRYYNNV